MCDDGTSKAHPPPAQTAAQYSFYQQPTPSTIQSAQPPPQPAPPGSYMHQPHPCPQPVVVVPSAEGQPQQVAVESQQQVVGDGGTVVEIGAPVPAAFPPGYLPPTLPPQPPNLWTSNLGDCGDDPKNCVETWLCPYCQLGYLHHKLHSGFNDLDTGVCVGYCCLDYCLTAGLALAVGSYQTREQIRTRFNIEPQEPCLNCAQGFFCAPCSLCQSYRELVNRGYWPDSVCGTDAPPATHPMGNPIEPAA